MKSSEEMVCSLLLRRDQYFAEQKRRYRVAARAAVAWCVICLAGLGGISMRRRALPDLSDVPEPPQVTSTTVAGTVAVAPTTTAPSTTTVHQLHWVTAEEFPAPAKMMISLMINDFVPMEAEAICGYYGIDIFPTVPEDLVRRESSLGIFRRGGGKGEIYWDSNALLYADAVGERHLSVQVDRDILPFDFCNLFAQVNERSQIGGVEVGLADNGRGELLAEFMREDVGFRLISLGLSREELVEIIRSLIGTET